MRKGTRRTIIIIVVLVIIATIIFGQCNKSRVKREESKASETTATQATTEVTTTQAPVESTATTEVTTTQPATATTVVSTPAPEPLPEDFICGQIHNSETGYTMDTSSFESAISFYGSYEEAFQNAFYLKESGRHVSYMIESGTKIENVETTVSFFDSESGNWISSDINLEVELLEVNGLYFVLFRIPDSPYAAQYTDNSVNVIVTCSAGDYYWACSY